MVEEEAQRNRAQGWSHAKKSGHENENIFGDILRGDAGFVRLLERKKFSDKSELTPEIVVDGAKRVPSIFGEETISKVDIEVDWGDSRRMGVSVKKSPSGQVWLVSVDKFIRSIEHYTGHVAAADIKLALALFIGGSNLEPHKERYLKALEKDRKDRPKIHSQEARQSRLVADSIQKNFPGVFEQLIELLTANIELVTSLSFSRGLAKSPQDWADVVVYNLVPGEEKVFAIQEMAENARRRLASACVEPGPRNGGSTILLPTGFMQMHRPQGENLVQFHHTYLRVLEIFAEKS